MRRLARRVWLFLLDTFTPIYEEKMITAAWVHKNGGWVEFPTQKKIAKFRVSRKDFPPFEG